ncbi:isochorismatase family protein [Nostocaceae cyanobacterium CENA369]|uniref:Isochorismatase family protein n=1 Tax=Dendronalium phyllosphericum CENA369 TaxID=1725256 RepID=A0A8J7IB39_9NOST|nr:isochorismatase family protein [Dendronalium phyllosphericum]MBH8577323.1 isochorismatase family protein [Dendronalium phyllosphericum CENA369]
MKFSDFTRENSAILLIDHQVGTMKLIKNLPLSEVEKNTLALAKVAKVLKIPVVLTSSQEERFQGLLMTALAQSLPEAYEKRVKRAGIVNAWDDENFVKAVKDTNRPNLIMAGITTDVCLVYPAISAVREGYSVQAVMDASGSPFHLSEDLARQRMHDAGVVLTATITLIAELVKDWSRPEGVELQQLLFSEILPPEFISGTSTPY